MTEPLTDPREMRKALRMAAIRGERIDGKPAGMGSHPANLARTAYHAAQHAGWSGEDEMTALAYHALRELERVTDLLLRDVSMQVRGPLMVRTEAVPGEYQDVADVLTDQMRERLAP